MDNTDLKVLNLKVTTRNQVPQGGGPPQLMYAVTYNIGTHGPFQDLYTAADYTAQKVQAAIQAQCDKLRTITAALQS